MLKVDESLSNKEKVESLKEQLAQGNFDQMVLKDGDTKVGTLYLMYGDSKGFEVYFVAVPNATPLSGVDGIVTRIELSFVDKTAKVERNLKEVKFSARNIEAVFKYINLSEFEKLIDDKDYPRMLSDLRTVASYYFGRRSGGYQPRKVVFELPLHEFLYGIVEEYGVLEVLYKAGLNLAPALVDALAPEAKGLPFFFDETKKKPHQILRTTKSQFSSLKELSSTFLRTVFQGYVAKSSLITEEEIDKAVRFYWEFLEKFHFKDSAFLSKLREIEDKYSLDILERQIFFSERLGERGVVSPLDFVSNYIQRFQVEHNISSQRGGNFTPTAEDLRSWKEEVLTASLGELYYMSQKNNLDYLRLIEYIYYECHVRQGITYHVTAKRLYGDYLRMQKKLMRIEQVTSRNIVKYPKSLKLAHDITMMNYNSLKHEIDKQEWKAIQSGLNELEWESEDYVIIAPKEPRELIEEGSSLHHCVSSYVDPLLKGRTKVLFLRSKKEQDKPLVTIEVKNGELRQAYGLSNRETTHTERKVLERYIKAKDLECSAF